MLVDPSMAAISDLTFRTAFVLYIVALVMSCIYYSRLLGVVDMRRERKELESRAVEAAADQKVAVGAGVGASVGAGTSFAQADDVPAGDTVSTAALDAEYDKRVAAARRWAGMTQALVWFGIVLHIAAFVTRGFAARRFPLGNLYEYLLLMTSAIMLLSLIHI